MIMSDEFRVIGKEVKDVSAFDKATGKIKFSNDIRLPGMLHAAMLRSPHARANVISIDATAAQALPGVKLVMTKDNFPMLFLASISWVGQDVACVVAEDLHTAQEACALINVEYEVLPFVIDPYKAMEPDAPIAMAGTESNLRSYDHMFFSEKNEDGLYTKREKGEHEGFGDMEAGRKEADLFVKAEGYVTAKAQAPLFETSGCAADFSDGKLTIYVPTQSTVMPRFNISQMFKLTLSKINCINYATGGGFGGRLGAGSNGPANEANYTMLATAATIELGLPVSLRYPRCDDFYYYWGRSGMDTKTEIGFKSDGTLVTMDTECWRNESTGGQIGVGTQSFDCTATGNMLYSHNCIANKYVKKSVATNSPVFVGWQGFGNPEVFFPVECAMDDAAEEMGIDPIELRRKNHMRGGDNFLPITYDWDGPSWLGHTGLDKCLDEGLKRVDWAGRKPASEKTGNLRHGIGMALCVQQNAGDGLSSDSIVKLQSDGSAILLCNYQDIGQSGRSAQCQIVAEALGIAYEKVKISADQSESTPYTHYQSCSSGTWIVGNATYNATMAAKKQLMERAAMVMGMPAENLETMDGMIYPKGMPDKGMPWIAAFMTVSHYGFWNDIIGHNHFRATGAKPAEQGVGFVELDVDVETGELKNIRYVQSQDCGRAINPRVVAAHYLSIHHGLEAVTGACEQILDPKTGKILNDNFYDYPVASILDHKVEPIVVEVADPSHPYGAVGIGQGFMNGIASAVSNAIYNAIGVRLKETPFTPDKVLKALGKI